MLPHERATHTAYRFRALAHPDRIRIYSYLIEREQPEDPPAGRVGEELASSYVSFATLGERLELSPASLSYHVRMLRETGLVESVRRGRRSFHRVRMEVVEELIQAVWRR